MEKIMMILAIWGFICGGVSILCLIEKIPMVDKIAEEEDNIDEVVLSIMIYATDNILTMWR